MLFDEDPMYHALLEKDATLEGSFFVGVKTTGIFCRPTCAAKKPKRENVEFYPSSKEAILSGYRPCPNLELRFSHDFHRGINSI